MLSYSKNSMLLKKMSSLLKHLLHQKNLCYIVNIVIKLGAYLHSEVHFCPHSRCQTLWERCLFSMAYVSLWIFGSMTPRSVRSTKLKFQSVANQFYWVCQTKPPRVLSCSLETYKQNDKFQNFHMSVVSLKMMIFFISWRLLLKTIFVVGCPLSSVKYAAPSWMSKLCGNAAFFQRNSETSLIETFIFEVT